MRNDTNKGIKLGLFVTIGVLLFAAAIYMLGRQQYLFGNNFRLSAIFSNVSGLQVGNNVRFNGIAIGSVNGIEIVTDSTVRVDMLLDARVRRFIKIDSRASISAEGLIGNKAVVISAGSRSAPSVKNRDIIASTRPLEFDDLLKSLQATTNNAEKITSGLAAMVENINTGQGTLGMLLTDENLAMDFRKTMENINVTTTTLRGTSARLSGQLNLVTQDVRAVTKKLRSGEGALGTLTTDTAFAGQMRSTMSNIEASSASFRENMEAMKHNFLFRGYFRKKEKEKLKQENGQNDKRKKRQEKRNGRKQGAQAGQSNEQK